MDNPNRASTLLSFPHVARRGLGVGPPRRLCAHQDAVGEDEVCWPAGGHLDELSVSAAHRVDLAR